jgi:hypothetical protein
MYCQVSCWKGAESLGPTKNKQRTETESDGKNIATDILRGMHRRKKN